MPEKKRLVICDRDGVLIHNNRSMKGGPYYVTKPDQIMIKKGVLQGIKTLAGAGFAFAMVTKQNCVSKGLLSPFELAVINSMVLEKLSLAPTALTTRVYWGAEDDCSARAAAIASVLYDFRVGPGDMDNVWMVDDSQDGLKAAKELGCNTIYIENLFAEAVLEDDDGAVEYADYVTTQFDLAAGIIVESV